jgi:hypothetical protein
MFVFELEIFKVQQVASSGIIGIKYVAVGSVLKIFHDMVHVRSHGATAPEMSSYVWKIIEKTEIRYLVSIMMLI